MVQHRNLDVVAFTKKVLRYANDLTDLLEVESTTRRDIRESAGKVLYVSYLVPHRKYYTSALLKANNLYI